MPIAKSPLARLSLKILLGSSRVRTKGFPMKISFALLTAATLLFFQMPAHARTIYPILPCRVFVDTDYTQIAEQCGTVRQFYPPRLVLRAARRSSHFYFP